MFDAALSPQQLQVIDALSEGLNSTDAAALAGVHRNTVTNWRRTSLFFREALVDAQWTGMDFETRPDCTVGRSMILARLNGD